MQPASQENHVLYFRVLMVIIGTILKKMPSLIIEDDQKIVNYKNFNKGGK